MGITTSVEGEGGPGRTNAGFIWSIVFLGGRRESPVAMYSPQSLHRWGITHSESMERLAYSQGKRTHRCPFSSKYMSNTLDNMIMFFFNYLH